MQLYIGRMSIRVEQQAFPHVNAFASCLRAITQSYVNDTLYISQMFKFAPASRARTQPHGFPEVGPLSTKAGRASYRLQRAHQLDLANNKRSAKSVGMRIKPKRMKKKQSGGKQRSTLERSEETQDATSAETQWTSNRIWTTAIQTLKGAAGVAALTGPATLIAPLLNQAKDMPESDTMTQPETSETKDSTAETPSIGNVYDLLEKYQVSAVDPDQCEHPERMQALKEQGEMLLSNRESSIVTNASDTGVESEGGNGERNEGCDAQETLLDHEAFLNQLQSTLLKTLGSGKNSDSLSKDEEQSLLKDAQTVMEHFSRFGSFAQASPTESSERERSGSVIAHDQATRAVSSETQAESSTAHGNPWERVHQLECRIKELERELTKLQQSQSSQTNNVLTSVTQCDNLIDDLKLPPEESQNCVMTLSNKPVEGPFPYSCEEDKKIENEIFMLCKSRPRDQFANDRSCVPQLAGLHQTAFSDDVETSHYGGIMSGISSPTNHTYIGLVAGSACMCGISRKSFEEVEKTMINEVAAKYPQILFDCQKQYSSVIIDLCKQPETEGLTKVLYDTSALIEVSFVPIPNCQDEFTHQHLKNICVHADETFENEYESLPSLIVNEENKHDASSKHNKVQITQQWSHYGLRSPKPVDVCGTVLFADTTTSLAASDSVKKPTQAVAYPSVSGSSGMHEEHASISCERDDRDKFVNSGEYSLSDDDGSHLVKHAAPGSKASDGPDKRDNELLHTPDPCETTFHDPAEDAERHSATKHDTPTSSDTCTIQTHGAPSQGLSLEAACTPESVHIDDKTQSPTLCKDGATTHHVTIEQSLEADDKEPELAGSTTERDAAASTDQNKNDESDDVHSDVKIIRMPVGKQKHNRNYQGTLEHNVSIEIENALRAVQHDKETGFTQLKVILTNTNVTELTKLKVDVLKSVCDALNITYQRPKHKAAVQIKREVDMLLDR